MLRSCSSRESLSRAETVPWAFTNWSSRFTLMLSTWIFLSAVMRMRESSMSQTVSLTTNFDGFMLMSASSCLVSSCRRNRVDRLTLPEKSFLRSYTHSTSVSRRSFAASPLSSNMMSPFLLSSFVDKFSVVIFVRLSTLRARFVPSITFFF